MTYTQYSLHIIIINSHYCSVAAVITIVVVFILNITPQLHNWLPLKPYYVANSLLVCDSVAFYIVNILFDFNHITIVIFEQLQVQKPVDMDLVD